MSKENYDFSADIHLLLPLPLVLEANFICSDFHFHTYKPFIPVVTHQPNSRNFVKSVQTSEFYKWLTMLFTICLLLISSPHVLLLFPVFCVLVTRHHFFSSVGTVFLVSLLQAFFCLEYLVFPFFPPLDQLLHPLNTVPQEARFIPQVYLALLWAPLSRHFPLSIGTACLSLLSTRL